MMFSSTLSLLLAATGGGAGVGDQNDSRPLSAAECEANIRGEYCDSIISRHSGPPSHFLQVTEYECEGVRFRLNHEAIYTDQELDRITVTVTNRRPGRLAEISAADIDRMRNRFDGATMASIDFGSCGVDPGTVGVRVTYSRMDWQQMRAALFTIRSDGSVDEGRDTLYP